MLRGPTPAPSPENGDANASIPIAVVGQQYAIANQHNFTMDKLVSWILTSLTTVVLAITAFWASELKEQVQHLSTQVASLSDRTSRLEVKLDSMREKIDDMQNESH